MAVDIHTMTVEELSAWLEEKDTTATFIDVREIDELEEQGVIEGYDDNIPWFLTNTNPDLFEKRFSELNKEEKVMRDIGKIEYLKSTDRLKCIPLACHLLQIR